MVSAKSVWGNLKKSFSDDGVVADSWKTKIGFIFAAMGSAIGLGNIWRFPGLAYENGGGAFLIPYFIALFLVGIPLLLMEFKLGYITKKAAPNAFASINKYLKVLGYAVVLNGFVIVSYYTVVIGWSFAFFLMALANNLSKDLFNNLISAGAGLFSGNITGLGLIYLGSFVFVWLVAYWILVKGVRGIEKVSMVFIPLMWFILLAFLIRALTLPGSFSGILQYLTPNFSALTNVSVWISAFGQVFFSLSLAFGIMVAYAKYLKKHSLKGSYLVALGNSTFELLAGFVVFGVLGFMMYLSNVALISQVDVPYMGAGLSFVTFPLAISQMPLGWIFGVLFFLLLFIAGLTSLISLVEAFASSLEEDLGYDRKKIIGVLTLIGILSGLIYIYNINYLDVVDGYVNYLLVFLGFAEAVAIAYFFKKLDFGKVLSFIAKFITPVLLGVIVVATVLQKIGKFEQVSVISTPETNIFTWIILGVVLAEFVVFGYLLYRDAKES